MIGQTISHYRILEKLGEGGMGVVYKAEDTKLDRTVALKFLAPEFTREPEAKARFIHEAKAAAALSHPNICTIYEVDEFERQSFIAMEYCEGETLKERISQGPLLLDEAVELASQIAEGLAKAHKQEIVHRDIKPANIFITNDGLVKILDFGLAKLAGQTRLTKTGTTLGTVAYMSPEQARGEEVDLRSDLWSLGTILYEMITGRPPFRGEQEAGMVYSILNEAPEPPTGVRTGVPMELERIISKCLARDPQERYQSAEGLLSDLRPLERSLTGTSIASGTKELSRPSARPALRWSWVLGLVLVVVALGIGAWLILQPGKGGSAPEEMALAVMDFQDLVTPDNLITAKGMAGLLHVGFVGSCPIRVVSPEYLQDLRRRHFGDAHGPIEANQALEVARQSGATYLLTGQIATLGTDRFVTWRLVDTQQGRSLAAKRVDGNNPADLADQIVADVLPVLAQTAGIEAPASTPVVGAMMTNSSAAYEHYVAGLATIENETWAAAAREFEQAVKIDSTFTLAYYQLSRVYSGYGRGAHDPKTARDYADQAWDLRGKLGIKDRLRLEAWRQELNRQEKDALATYREMLARWPDDRQLLGDLAREMFYCGHHVEAVTFNREALRLYPDDFRLHDGLANGLGYLGRFDEALEASRVLVHLHPEVTSSWHELGQRFLEMGLPDSAEVALRRSLELSPNNVYAQRYFSYCAHYRGNTERAIELQNRILEREDLLPGERIRLLSGHAATPDLPQLHAEMGQFGRALELIDAALQYAVDREMEIIIESGRSRWLLRTGQAEEVVRWARDLLGHSIVERLPTFEPLESLGRAQVALDSLEAGRSTAARMLALAEQTDLNHNQLRALKITAEISLAEGNPKAALAALNEMDRLGMYRAVGLDNIEWREAVSHAHRMAGRLNEAAKVHEELLGFCHGHALSHYDLGQIYEEMDRLDDAEQEYMTFLEMWSEADEGLPQLEDARARLAALQARP